MTARYDFVIKQGETVEILFRPLDSSGAAVAIDGGTARMTVRPVAGSSDLLLDLTTGGGGLVIADDEVTATITAAQTGAMTRSGVYDLRVTLADSTVLYLVEGVIDLQPRISV